VERQSKGGRRRVSEIVDIEVAGDDETREDRR
jgi:hypothetical protein